MSDNLLSQSLLPPNASKLLKDLEAVSINCFNLPTLNHYVANPNLAPNHILPWLAWALSVDDWSDDWPDIIKRNIIKASISVHKKKGTIGALRAALEAFNYQNIKVAEWFEYGGEPYYFRVFFDVSQPGFDIAILPQIQKLINNTKNARSHLESLKACLIARSAVGYGAIFTLIKEVTILHPL